jgi:hypothetical protein
MQAVDVHVHKSRMKENVQNCHWKLENKGEFLDVSGTAVLEVFLLAIHSHIH